MESQFKQTAEQISLKVSKETYDSDKQTFTESINSQFKVQADNISAVSTRVTSLETASAGWITEAGGNKLWASKTLADGTELTSLVTQTAAGLSSKVSSKDYNGNTIVSMINQTDKTVTINAGKINLKGQVTFEMFDADTQAATTAQPNLSDYVKKETIIDGNYIKTGLINTGELVATNIAATSGTIGGFNIGKNNIYSIYAGESNDRFKLDPTGGIYFNNNSNMTASFGLGIPCVNINLNSTSQTNQQGIYISCSSLNTAIPLRMIWDGGTEREISFSWRYIDDSYKSFMRSLVKFSALPVQSQIDKITTTSVSKYTVYYDANSGYLFIG